MGGGEMRPYGHAHPLQIIKHVGCEKPQRPEAFLCQHGVALIVALVTVGITVLRAVHFDDQPQTVTYEIEHVAAKRRLAPKMMAFMAESSQKAPERAFGWRGVAA